MSFLLVMSILFSVSVNGQNKPAVGKTNPDKSKTEAAPAKPNKEETI